MAKKYVYKSDNSIYTTVIVGVIGVVGISLIVRMIRRRRQSQSGKRVLEDENVRIATELNTAIHPGRSWVSNIFISANKEEIFRLGSYITDFDDVATEYRNLYQKSLTHELQDALGDDYSEFITKLKKVKLGTDYISGFEAGELVDNLNNEIDGLNWFGRKSEPFEALLKLSDADFRTVIQLYDQKYKPDTFMKSVNEEYGFSVIGLIAPPASSLANWSWSDVKEAIAKRYNTVF